MTLTTSVHVVGDAVGDVAGVDDDAQGVRSRGSRPRGEARARTSAADIDLDRELHRNRNGRGVSRWGEEERRPLAGGATTCSWRFLSMLSNMKAMSPPDAGMVTLAGAATTTAGL